MSNEVPEIESDPEPEDSGRSPIPFLVVGFLALLAAFLVVGTLIAGDDQEPEGEPAPEVVFELIDGGGETNLTQFTGQPTVLNFFASWCAPCVRELPDFQEAFETYDGEVNFIGLSVSDRENDTLRLLEDTGVTFTVGTDPNGEIHRQLSDLGVMPTTIFLADDGSILSVHAGAISAEDLDKTIQEELLSSQ